MGKGIGIRCNNAAKNKHVIYFEKEGKSMNFKLKSIRYFFFYTHGVWKPVAREGITLN